MKNNDFSENGYIQHVCKNAEAGQSWAQKAMGDVFYFGIGMEKLLDNLNDEERHKKDSENYKKAFKWYHKAAEQGEASAMRALGNAYCFGEGVGSADAQKASAEKAIEWYSKAADAGDAKSLHSLANMYEESWGGITQDLPKAEELYFKAITDHLHKDSIYPWARLCLNPENDARYDDVLHLLLIAENVDANKAAAKHAIEHHNLWSNVSHAQRKHCWDSAYHDARMNWDAATKKAVVSGISAKIAVAEHPSESLPADEVFNRVWRSVVSIKDESGFVGSGVIVQPDVVATNFHVVTEALKHESDIWVCQPKEQSGRKEIPYPVDGHPILSDGDEDYCLLHVPFLPGSGVPATIRRYDTLKIGETVYALGAPRGERLSLSKGIISQLRETPRECFIQSDVGVAGGSSGGGLFDSMGNLIGHPTFGTPNLETGGDEKGLEYSIPADIVLEFGKESKAE